MMISHIYGYRHSVVLLQAVIVISWLAFIQATTIVPNTEVNVTQTIMIQTTSINDSITHIASPTTTTPVTGTLMETTTTISTATIGVSASSTMTTSSTSRPASSSTSSTTTKSSNVTTSTSPTTSITTRSTYPLTPTRNSTTSNNSDETTTIVVAEISTLAGFGNDNTTTISTTSASVTSSLQHVSTEPFSTTPGVQTTSVPVLSETSSITTETTSTVPSQEPKSSDAWRIAVGVVVPVVVIAAIAAIVLFFCCRCRNKNTKKVKSPESPWTTPRYSSNYSKPCPVGKFVQHVAEMEKDSGLLFASEFEELKGVGKNQSTDIAVLPKNRDKNRFANIKPYDVALVKLKPTSGDDSEEDYINASWMPGYNSKREYISTQGPMPNTKDDFWRMIWEYECCGIVMLANCMENGMIKCDHYWPYNREPVTYGDLTVTITNEKLTDQWDVRDIEISQGPYVQNIKHLHYHIWDDMDVPKNPDSILHFIQVVREETNSLQRNSKEASGQKPLVVHCSAGVGRSGTFIALDTLLRQMDSDNQIDVFRVVHNLRMNRISMVQTEMQYIFLHKCLTHVIERMKGKDNPAYVKDSADDNYVSDSSVKSFTGPVTPRANGRNPTSYGAAPPVTSCVSTLDRTPPGTKSMATTAREFLPSVYSIGNQSSNTNSFYDVRDSQSIGLVNLAPPTPVSTSPVASPRRKSGPITRDNQVTSVYPSPSTSPYNSNIQIESL